MVLWWCHVFLVGFNSGFNQRMVDTARTSSGTFEEGDVQMSSCLLNRFGRGFKGFHLVARMCLKSNIIPTNFK